MKNKKALITLDAQSTDYVPFTLERYEDGSVFLLINDHCYSMDSRTPEGLAEEMVQLVEEDPNDVDLAGLLELSRDLFKDPKPAAE